MADLDVTSNNPDLEVIIIKNTVKSRVSEDERRKSPTIVLQLFQSKCTIIHNSADLEPGELIK